jgi:anti-anti-sigma regulatory factor
MLEIPRHPDTSLRGAASQVGGTTRTLEQASKRGTAKNGQDKAPTLSVRLETHEELCLLTLCGEVCGSSVGALEAQIDQLGCMRYLDVALDFSQVTKLDLLGARVVDGLRHYIEALGGRLTINGAREDLSRLLELGSPAPMAQFEATESARQGA